MNDKITIELPNGDSLVAEVCPHEGGQIAIGVMRDGSWIQDLAIVETANDDDDKYVEDKFNVIVYSDEFDECYTNLFEVKRIQSSAL